MVAGHLIAKRAHDPRLADTGLAAQEHKLSFTVCRLAPALEKECQFLVATNHRQRHAALSGVESARGLLRPNYPECQSGPLKTFHELRAQIVQFKHVADQATRHLAEHDSSWFGD